MKRPSSKKRVVLVFGVFDCLHAGHRYFLARARAKGDKLTAVVARSIAVRTLKRKTPRDSQRMRLAALRKLRAVSRAVLGDRKRGSYAVVKKYKPAVICLGYDQRALGRDIGEKIRLGALPKIRLVYMRAYRPEKYHTSMFP